VLSFFFNTPAPSSVYTLSLHDALPIWCCVDRTDSEDVALREEVLDLDPVPVRVGEDRTARECQRQHPSARVHRDLPALANHADRSEEHTSELQSRFDLVCRLLLEKKKK